MAPFRPDPVERDQVAPQAPALRASGLLPADADALADGNCLFDAGRRSGAAREAAAARSIQTPAIKSNRKIRQERLRNELVSDLHLRLGSEDGQDVVRRIERNHRA